jgi:DNA-binding beta-propeller fold protein YncE
MMIRHQLLSLLCGIVWLCPGQHEVQAAQLGAVEKDFSFHANGLLLDPNRPLLYASTNSGLEIINTNTLSVVNFLPIPFPSYGMSFSADNSRLYIAGGVSDSLTVLDTQAQAFLPSVQVGSHVYAVATGLSNRLFVVDGNSFQRIDQIDANSGQPVGPPVLSYAYSGGLKTSPDHTTLYYATYGLSPGDLYKIDVSTTTANVLYHNAGDIGENGEQLVLSPNGSMVAYVCGYGDGGYQIPNFRTQDMTLKNIFPTGAYPDALAFSPDGKLAYALHTIYPTAVDVYDTTTSARIGQFAAADNGSDMIVDNTGQHLFVSFDGVYYNDSDLIAYGTGVVPEPSTLLLGLIGAGGVGIVVRGRLSHRDYSAEHPPRKNPPATWCRYGIFM